MPTTVPRTCHLCEATCGLVLTVEGDRVLEVRGDKDDPFSKGYLCPKAVALKELHEDPDWLKQPMRRTAGGGAGQAAVAAPRGDDAAVVGEAGVGGGGGEQLRER